MLKKSNKLLWILLLLSISVNGQIAIDPTPTPFDIVTNTLIGPGLATSNITFMGNANQIGTFNAGTSNIGLPSGVVMSSGNVTSIVAGGNPSSDLFGPGDADVLATAQSVTTNPNASGINSTNDAAVLEFDFVPDGDVVVFNFTFASEEYLTWINSQFNDAFGFYLSGPNPTGGNYTSENLALVPGTTEPITISTIYIDPSQTPPSMNGEYFLNNPIGHSFNGFTIPIEIRFNVICDSMYHFKFAVADCVDGILDTGVFLEGGSFQSVPVDISLETNIDESLFGDSVIFEGCNTDADFIFTRPSCQSGDSLYITLQVAGSASNGIDYELLPDSVLFLPGETEVTMPFTAFQDGTFEGFEDVVITVTTILDNGNSLVTSGTIWLYDQPTLTLDSQDTLIYCLEDSLDVFSIASGGLPPYTYIWSNSNDTIGMTTVPINLNGTVEYYVEVIDFCGFTDNDTLTVTVNQTLTVEAILNQNTSSCDNSGIVSSTWSGESLIPPNVLQFQWLNQSESDSINASVWTNLPGGWYTISLTDDVCSVSDSVFVDIESPPIADFSANIIDGCNPLTVNFTNLSQNTSSYTWDFGDGSTSYILSPNDQGHTFSQTSTVELTAYTSDTTCFDVTSIEISIVNCGCTDPDAINHEPNAVVDDGSCIYPFPSVTAPNVFTPNSDNENDVFFLTHENTVSIKLIVLNRWGNVMHEGTTDLTNSNARAEWDGKTREGLNAEEGTYFYKYVATGIDDTEIEGHGFFQLLP
jgi:gliding motility-associated-like protein